MIIVHKTKIIDADTTVFSAWESFDGHSTIRYENNVCFGRVGTRRLPSNIKNLPMGEERTAAVNDFYQQQYETAYKWILKYHPDAVRGICSMGQISL